MAEVDIREQLKRLVESSTMNWTYAILWRSYFDLRPAFKWDGGYCKLLGTGKKTKDVRNFGSSVTVTDEQVTDAEWFFNISMAQSFVDLPDTSPARGFFHSCRFRWLTGSEELLGSQWKRAKQAQEHGIQTLLLVRFPTVVMELGSTQIIPYKFAALREIVTDWLIPPIREERSSPERADDERSSPERADDEMQDDGRDNIADDEMQDRGRDNIYKQSRGKEKLSDSKWSWPLLTESSDRGTDRTFSYSDEYSGPS